jgi:hypothetical protein
VFWLNTFPARDGVSKTLSPRSTVTGSHIDYNKHCKLEYGAYVQVHEEHNNSMITRTTGAIALRPTGNSQGGYYFYSLTTGRVLNRNNWTPLPLPQDVIDRVHTLARRAAANAALTFGNGYGEPIPDDDDDDDDDEDYLPPDEASHDGDDSDNNVDNDDDDDYPFDEGDDAPDDDPDDVAGVMGYLPIGANYYGHNVENENGGENETEDANAENENANARDDNDANAGIENAEDVNEITEPAGELDPVTATDADGDDNNENEATHAPFGESEADPDPDIEEEVEDTVDEIMDRLYGPRNTSHGLRPRKPREYDHLHTTIEDTWTESGLMNTP